MEGIIGVVVGFLLSELSIWFREKRETREKVASIKEELKSIKAQIPQLKDICRQAHDAFLNKSVLPALSVPAVTSSYEAFHSEVMNELNQKEKNCLHIIYSRLSVADHVLGNLEHDFRSAIEQGVYHDAFEAFAGKMDDLLQSYDVIVELIDSYISEEPIDVFDVGG